MIPKDLQEEVEIALDTEAQSFHQVAGGCINHGGKLTTALGEFFLKWNDLQKYPGMFEAERLGLQLLQQHNTIITPRVVDVVRSAKHQALILEWIEPGKKSRTYWHDLGHELASLHRITAPMFGLSHSNYIGSLRQLNNQSDNWVQFFVEQRLEVQLRIAIDSGTLSSNHGARFEKLYRRLQDVFPSERPALLHGDLWGGNLITATDGKPCLVDPAVYFGNREVELAFTKLFGGFDGEFYRTYEEDFPLEPGFEDRIDIYNLYPLLVHVNLFGGSYVNQVVSIVNQFA